MLQRILQQKLEFSAADENEDIAVIAHVLFLFPVHRQFQVLSTYAVS